jgi:hypothetical protein
VGGRCAHLSAVALRRREGLDEAEVSGIPTKPSTDEDVLAEAQAIRTEVSAGRVIYHAIKYGESPSTDPRRDASLEAVCLMLGRLLRPTLPKIGGALLALFGAWIAWQTWQTSVRQAE